MIWRVLSRYAELSSRTLVADSGTAYAMLDGIFERGLLRHLTGDPDAVTTMHVGQASALIPALLAD